MNSHTPSLNPIPVLSRGSAAAAVVALASALALTWALGWSFVDSTRVARWAAPATAVAQAASGVAAAGRALPARVVM